MEATLGIMFSFLALLGWGVGDFMIQKSVRQNSVMRTLFYICISGGVVLYPFIREDLLAMNENGNMHMMMIVTSLVILAAATFEFIGMKRGKISIIEPILSFELPVAVILSIFLRNESLSAWQLLLIAAAFMGILIASQSNKKLFDLKNLKLENGIFWAMGGAALMGLVNFLVGVASQETSALLTIWYTNMIIAVICAIHFSITKEWKKMRKDFKENPLPIGLTCIFDNGAWIAYALATTHIPISIASTISESYIALTVALGIFINREVVHKHQLAGIALTVIGVFALTANSSI